jgi:hypothetical protein
MLGHAEQADESTNDEADDELKGPCEPIGVSFHWGVIVFKSWVARLPFTGDASERPT